jgi:hypothetical protein
MFEKNTNWTAVEFPDGTLLTNDGKKFRLAREDEQDLPGIKVYGSNDFIPRHFVEVK